MTGETRRHEYVPQPVQRQIQHHKYVMQVEVHAPVQPPKPEVCINSQVPEEALDKIGHSSILKDPIPGESGVLEPFEQNVMLCYVYFYIVLVPMMVHYQQHFTKKNFKRIFQFRFIIL